MFKHRKKPVLRVAQIEFQHFEKSVRLHLIVENKDEQVARNAAAYLTITLYKDGERITNLLENCYHLKSGSKCLFY